MIVTDPKQFGKVAVLMGGTAAERDISLVSGKAVLDSLLTQQVNAIGVDIGHDAVSQLYPCDFDRAFNVLHGRGGEDGVIQGLLDLLNVPYTGSDVLGSALSMNKVKTKLVWQGLGLPTPGFVLMRSSQDLEAANELGFPLIVKPVSEGSSIGMSYVEDMDALQKAWDQASQFDHHVLAERWVTGSEYTVGVLGDDVLPMIRLETTHQFYDYAAKYQSNKTQYHIPCGLDLEKQKQCQQLAMTAFKSVGCSGWGRVDFMMDEEDQLWLIEVNSVPGMTSHSLVPMAAHSMGMDFDQLVWKILEQTLNKH